VVEWLEVELPRRAPAPYLDIGGLVTTRRHRLVQQVGQVQQPLVDLGLHFVEPGFAARQLAGQLLAALQQWRGVLALALGHADGLGVGVALGAQLVGRHLPVLAPFLERGERGDVEREAAAREVRGDGGGIGTQGLGIEQLRSPRRTTRRAHGLPSRRRNSQSR